MRILHTSDWHLGRSFHGEDLLAAQAAYVDHLIETVEAEGVDLVVVAGDVYDRALPPVDAVALADDALAAGRSLGIDPAGLAAVLSSSSSACIASGVRLRAGSLAGIATSPAGPTLAKDVQLMAAVLGDAPGHELVDSAQRFVTGLEQGG